MNRLIPKPNGFYQEKDGYFMLESLINVYKGDFSSRAISAFEERLELTLSEVPANQAALRLFCDDGFAHEAYRLVVDESGVQVTAADESGVIWALTSLYSLLEKGGFPYVTIEDEPKYTHRGFMMDCARHFFSVAVVKEIIEQNSLVKLNVFHWHLSDDQGWRVESTAFPRLHELSGQEYYTKEQLCEVATFAAVRGVEIIPEIDMPGHMLAAIAAYPSFSCRGEATAPATQAGIYETILCAGKEETYEFAKTVLDELCEVFPGSYIHIGGDEVPKKEWEACPYCREKLAAIGRTDFEELQSHFMQEMFAHLTERGKQSIAWNDVLKGTISPNEVVVQHWLEIGESDCTRPFLEKGGKVIFSDMFALYFDYTEGFSGLKRVYEYTPTIKGELFSEHDGCLGIQACLWSERVADVKTLHKRIYPRLFAVAEAAWSKERDYDDFELRLGRKLKALKRSRIGYRRLKSCNPKKIKRTMEVMKFMKGFSAARETGNAPDFSPEMIQQFLDNFGLTELIRKK